MTWMMGGAALLVFSLFFFFLYLLPFSVPQEAVLLQKIKEHSQTGPDERITQQREFGSDRSYVILERAPLLACWDGDRIQA